MLGRDKMLQVIESAFAPGWCVAQLQKGSYGELFGFRVYDTIHQPMLTWERLPVAEYRKEESLFALISDARELAKSQGMVLDAWSFQKAASK